MLRNARQRTGIARIVVPDLDEVMDPVARLKHRHAIGIRHHAFLNTTATTPSDEFSITAKLDADNGESKPDDVPITRSGDAQ
jgi:hypothetical protein